MSRHLRKISFVTALLLSVPLIRAVMQPAVGRQEFEQRMRSFFADSGYRVTSESTEAADSVPLPLSLQMRSIISGHASDTKATTSFPDSVLRWGIWSSEERGRLSCFILVRYHEGNAVHLVLSSNTIFEKQRRDLRDEIARLFPSLKITFEDLCPPEWARMPQQQ